MKMDIEHEGDLKTLELSFDDNDQVFLKPR